MIEEAIKSYMDLKGIDWNNADIYSFMQVWGSTALGVGGIGGAAITEARTVVVVDGDTRQAYIFFGDKFAYDTGICRELMHDIVTHNVASIVEKEKYKKWIGVQNEEKGNSEESKRASLQQV